MSLLPARACEPDHSRRRGAHLLARTRTTRHGQRGGAAMGRRSPGLDAGPAASPSPGFVIGPGQAYEPDADLEHVERGFIFARARETPSFQRSGRTPSQRLTAARRSNSASPSSTWRPRAATASSCQKAGRPRVQADGQKRRSRIRRRAARGSGRIAAPVRAGARRMGGHPVPALAARIAAAKRA